MQQTIIIRGRYASGIFHPDKPLPDGEGSAELIITPLPAGGDRSLMHLAKQVCFELVRRLWLRCRLIEKSGVTADLSGRKCRHSISRGQCCMSGTD